VANTIKINNKLKLLSTPLVMGILNYNDNSFYNKSRVGNSQALVKQVKRLIKEGADIIDIGIQSTRPGAQIISEAKEIEALKEALKIIKSESDLIISVDTFRAKTADFALNNGADILNDISGWQIDEELLSVISDHKKPYILTHMRGTPETMQENTNYKNLVLDIASYFKEKIEILEENDVNDIIIDLGFGFAKTKDQNYELLKNLKYFTALDLPLLVGVSRKSMIYKELDCSPEESLNGTSVLNTIALQNGANILRVHDVKEAKQAIKLWSKTI
jgi:dihydropteroate synthase